MSDTTDEQDLIKALDSVTNSAGMAISNPVAVPVADQSQIGMVASPFEPLQPAPSPLPPQSTPGYLAADPMAPPIPLQTPDPVQPSPDTSEDLGPLGSIKQDALAELRPLVDKLNVSVEEKFDTYLLLIRSTDDVDLIAPAHETAKQITDETRRAEALLDIIKEIDYLSKPKEQ